MSNFPRDVKKNKKSQIVMTTNFYGVYYLFKPLEKLDVRISSNVRCSPVLLSPEKAKKTRYM